MNPKRESSTTPVGSVEDDLRNSSGSTLLPSISSVHSTSAVSLLPDPDDLLEESIEAGNVAQARHLEVRRSRASRGITSPSSTASPVAQSSTASHGSSTAYSVAQSSIASHGSSTAYSAAQSSTASHGPYSMNSTSSRVRAMAGSTDDDDKHTPYPRHHPSSIGFPVCWDHEMSRCLAYLDAYDGTDHRVTIRKLKEHFPILTNYSMPVAMMERAHKWVMMNSLLDDDCRAGAEDRVADLRAQGIDIPDEPLVESIPLPSPAVQQKSDLELFGPGDHVPMTGRLAPGYVSEDEEENISHGVGSMHVEEDDDMNYTPRQVQIAGEYSDTSKLADITNARNRSHTGSVPSGGPHNLDEPSSSRARAEENASPTIQQRRAAKRHEEEEKKK
ncbi:hypothetical protein P7C71_g157, partial [Lecanoromycetidae sp. Uapishka_2]